MCFIRRKILPPCIIIIQLYIGGEDYVNFDKTIYLNLDDERRECVAIVIREDFEPEINEYFEVTVEDLRISTRVVILDDDGMLFYWVLGV